MPYSQNEIAQIMPRIREMLRISTKLERLFPNRKFTLDGHLVGSIGEVFAAYSYDLELLPSSAERHDARTRDGREVQIKATQGMRTVALRSCPDYLIVLRISGETGDIAEVYNGPGMPVWDACGKVVSNGTRPISLRKLAALTANVSADQRIGQAHPVNQWIGRGSPEKRSV